MPEFEPRTTADDERLCGLSVVLGVGSSWDREGWRAVLEAARTAELCGFHSLWLTGGSRTVDEVQPNPALIAAAVSVSTQRIRLRVEMAEQPRPDPLRVAEDWSVVDNLSNTRVELISTFGRRKDGESADRARAQILSIRDLWGGKRAPRVGPGGEEYSVQIHPTPQRADPMFWLADFGDGPGPRLSAEMNTGVYVVNELAFDQLEERVEVLQEQFQAVNGKPGRVAVAAGTAIRPEEVQEIYALGVEEVVHKLDIEATRGALTEAITELARANDLVAASDVARPQRW